MNRVPKFDDPEYTKVIRYLTETKLFYNLKMRMAYFSIALSKAFISDPVISEHLLANGFRNLKVWTDKISIQEKNLDNTYRSHRHPNTKDKNKYKDLILDGNDILEIFLINSGKVLKAEDIINLRSLFTSCKDALEEYMPTPRTKPQRTSRQKRALELFNLGTSFDGSRSLSPPSRTDSQQLADLCDMRRLLDA